MGDAVNNLAGTLPAALLPQDTGHARRVRGLYQRAKALIPALAHLVNKVNKAARNLFEFYWGGTEALVPVCYRLMTSLGWNLGDKHHRLEGGNSAATLWKDVLCFEDYFTWNDFRKYAAVYHCTLDGQPWHGVSLRRKYEEAGTLTDLVRAARAALAAAREMDVATTAFDEVDGPAPNPRNHPQRQARVAAAHAITGTGAGSSALTPSHCHSKKGSVGNARGGKQPRTARSGNHHTHKPQEGNTEGVLYPSQRFHHTDGEAWVQRVRILSWCGDGEGIIRIPRGVFHGLPSEMMQELRTNGHVVVNIASPALQREMDGFGLLILGMYQAHNAGIDGEGLVETLSLTENGTLDDRYIFKYLHHPAMQGKGLLSATASIPDIVVRTDSPMAERDERGEVEGWALRQLQG